MTTPALGGRRASVLRGPAADYGPPRCVHALFAEQVARTPDAPAVEDAAGALSYRELDRRAGRWAARLAGRGVRRGDLVGILLRPSVEMIAGVLGVLKAGAAYVPLDPAYPRERLRLMAEDAALRLVLVEPGTVELLPGAALEPVTPPARDEDDDAAGAPGTQATPADLAYVMYTSGSTGTPKGVMVPHAAVHNRLAWDHEEFALGPRDVVLSQTSLSFDISVWEIFAPLTAGACVVVADPAESHDPAYLIGLMRRRGVTRLALVPSLLEALLDERPGLATCTALADVFCGGEALPTELHRRLAAVSAAGLTNFYGPTEATVDVSFWRSRVDEAASIVPIGTPIANVSAHVLNEDGRPVPAGAIGELHVGGAGLAAGYLGRPEQTAERFAIRDGVRLFRTGDRVRERADGALEFLGRLDEQVKLHGHRIELGDVDAALRRCPGVGQATSAVLGERSADRRLVAWVAADGGAVVDQLGVRRAMAAAVPEHMVPSQVVVLDALPRTPSGKLDRARLPEPTANVRVAPAGDAAVAPVDRIAEQFALVLGVEQMSPTDGFFALGGTSLQAMKLVGALRASGIDVRLSTLLSADTPAALAAALAMPEAGERAAAG